MNCVKVIVLASCMLFSPILPLFAQNEGDSIKALLEESSGTDRVILLNKLAYEYSYSDPGAANAYATEALNLAKSLNDKKGIAKSLMNLGHLSFDKADYQKALKLYLDGLEINEGLREAKGVANSLVCVGNVYLLLENYEKCLEYYKGALDNYKKADDTNNMSSVLGNIGAVYLQRQDFEGALEYFFQALNIQKDLGDKRVLANTFSNIGTAQRELGYYEEALKNLSESLKLREELNEQQEGLTLINIAGVYAKLKDRKKAEVHYNSALLYAERNGDKNLMKLAYQELSDLYRQSGEFAEALRYKDLYMQVKDSIFNSDNARLITEMEKKYESEKQQKEIQLLTKNKEHDQLVKGVFGGGAVVLLLLAGVIYNRYRVKHKANQQLSHAYGVIEEKNKIVEEKNKSITDSIKYAKRIQQAILPITTFTTEFREKGFILYKPKDIVSGDFYWMEKKGNKLLVAAVDCTGHGVPGAFMSIVGYNLLNQIVNEHGITNPGAILDELNKGVTDALRQKVEETSVKDGMDLSLIAIDYENNILEYAGAYNPLLLLRERHMVEVKADKFPIGSFVEGEVQRFTNHRIDIEKNDIIYLFSDGYADQFGGPTGKKFKYKNLKELLVSISKYRMDEQQRILDETIEKWRGDLEQVDDIMVVGIKI